MTEKIKKQVSTGVCPYCDQTLYIADTTAEKVVFECWGDNRVFVLTRNDVTDSVIETCNKFYSSN